MLEVRGVAVSFGSVRAVDGVDLDVAEGETLVLVGPSGCGKSSLLRIIAGLQPPDRGVVLLDRVDQAGVPPHLRQMGLMFQDNVLFGHRDVGANVAFGPRMQRLGSIEAGRIVAEMLELVGLPGYEHRDVATLSGGEAQRVALARSLAARPRLMMLDEPLGSLDRALRDRLVDDLPQMLRSVGVTTIHVTHDHDEAFALADRVAVMHDGRVIRVGPPVEVWRDPRSETVARFLGHRNIVSVGDGGVVPWGRVGVPPGRWVVRTDALGPASAGEVAAVEARVLTIRYRGDRFELRVLTEPGGIELTVMWPSPVAPGDHVNLRIDPTGLARLG